MNDSIRTCGGAARRLCLLILGMQCIASSLLLALDPNLPPSGNFDLTRWNITLPVDSSGGNLGLPLTIQPSQLSAGYEYPPYFYTGLDGEMVFGVPFDGATGGTSTHPRSELRESNPDDTLYNWRPGDAGGTHVMEGICVVENVGNGKVSIGQIHGKEPNVPAVILRFDSTTTPARVYCTVKKDPFVSILQDTLYFTENIAIGQPIFYRLAITGSATSCIFSVTVNGETRSIDMYANSPFWANVTFYYKAGAYYTNPDDGQTAVVGFYFLEVTHSNGVPVATPEFSPAGGSYPGPQTVSLETATEGAEIRYTTDGSMPSRTHSELYAGPITVDESTTLKAIASKSGMANSAVATASYTIFRPHAVPAVLEAESASLDPGYWEIVADGGASGGQAVCALIDSPETPPAAGGLVYPFSLSSNGTVHFHVRGSAAGPSANGCWARVDAGAWTKIHFTGGGYRWKRVSASLAAGTHTFEVRCLDAGIRIDQVAATLSAHSPH